MASLSFCGKRKRWPAFLTRRDSSAKRDGLALLAAGIRIACRPISLEKFFPPQISIAKSPFRRRFVAPLNCELAHIDQGSPVLERNRATDLRGSVPCAIGLISSAFARTAIIIVVFVLTMLAMMDNSAQLLADLGKVVFETAVSASWR
jgi:hypothetical protein